MTQAPDIVEAFLDEEEAIAPSAPDALRAVVPPPPNVDVDELEQESSQHRLVIVRRGAVIALTTILSIGGALFIHALLAGLIVVGIFFPSKIIQPVAGGAPIGESESGVLRIAAGEIETALPAAAATLQPAPLPAPALPTLPTLAAVTPTRIEQTFTPPPLPLPAELGTVRVVPAMPAPEATIPIPLTPTTPGGTNRILGPLPGDLPPEDETGSIHLPAGRGGSGGGIGSGRGPGIDRGMSAANRPAQVLSLELTSLNRHLTAYSGTKLKNVKFELTILPNGDIGTAKVLESSGIGDVDQLILTTIRASSRFSPAYEAGKPITSTFPLSITFDDLN